MNTAYEMDVLKTIVSHAFGTNLVKKSNKKESVSARKIFSKILIDRGYTNSEVGKYLNMSNSSIHFYIKDVEYVFKFSPEIELIYKSCKDSFSNVVSETKNEENKNIVTLQMRIDELISERDSMKKEINGIKRIKRIVDLVEFNTKDGDEDAVYNRIRKIFNQKINYEWEPE
jgi:predicted transcriptional regulator